MTGLFQTLMGCAQSLRTDQLRVVREKVVWRNESELIGLPTVIPEFLKHAINCTSMRRYLLDAHRIEYKLFGSVVSIENGSLMFYGTSLEMAEKIVNQGSVDPKAGSWGPGIYLSKSCFHAYINEYHRSQSVDGFAVVACLVQLKEKDTTNGVTTCVTKSNRVLPIGILRMASDPIQMSYILPSVTQASEIDPSKSNPHTALETAFPRQALPTEHPAVVTAALAAADCNRLYGFKN